MAAAKAASSTEAKSVTSRASRPPARAGLDDVEPLGVPHQPPHLFELYRDQCAKGRMCVRTGKEISRRADAGRLTADDVVPAGPIQRKFHEFGEGNPPLRLDRGPYRSPPLYPGP